MQQQLRATNFSAGADSAAGVTPLQAVAKHLLQCKGSSVASRVVPTRLSPAVSFRSTPKFVAQGAPAAISLEEPNSVTVLYAVLSRPRAPKQTFLPRVRAFGFLNKLLRPSVEPRYTAVNLQATATLNRRDRRYRELRFYHNRPKMRLPRTRITRRRRRKAGLVTFARNSLQQARSLLGQARMLLPPTNAYSRITAKRIMGFVPTAASLVAYKRRTESHPRFCMRPPTRANIKAIARVRRRRYARAKRRLKRLRRHLHVASRKVLASKTPKRAALNFTAGKTTAQQKFGLNAALSATALLRHACVKAPAQELQRFPSRVGRKKIRKVLVVRPTPGTIGRTRR